MEGNTSHSSIELASDASGSWGCGAWWGPRWFQYVWDAMSSKLDISSKELFPIVVAAVVWGDLWRGSSIICHCDNQAVIAVMGSRSCHDEQLMHLL